MKAPTTALGGSSAASSHVAMSSESTDACSGERGEAAARTVLFRGGLCSGAPRPVLPVFGGAAAGGVVRAAHSTRASSSLSPLGRNERIRSASGREPLAATALIFKFSTKRKTNTTWG